MNLSEIIFNQNILKIFSNIKETYEEKETKIKKSIGNMNKTTLWGIIIIFTVIFTLFSLGIVYIFNPGILEKLV